MVVRPIPNLMVAAMDVFTELFGNPLAFVYHCFDRIVIHGYLSALSRPEQVVHFVRKIVGVPVVSKEILSQRTADYQNWVEAYARNHHTPIEWAENGVRKEDHVRPWLRRMANKNAYGVYFIFKSMEQGPSFRISVPKYPTQDPHHRILARQRSRYTHYYFYIRDEVLGPMVMRVASFFPFQTTYYLNGHSFIEQELTRAQVGFRKNDNAFLAIDDVAALQAAADRLSPDIIRKRLDYWTLILGPKFSAKERKQLNLSRFYAISQIEYCRNFVFKRAQWLNVHVDFPLLQRIALPITIGSVRYPGIKIHDTRVIRLCEVLLHGGTHVGGWTANQIHQAVLTTFHLSDKGYSLNQLRYDLRKLRGHGLIERDGTRYAYRLTPKGVQVALLFLFFHKRLCGPLANSHFHHQPDAKNRPHSQLEAAYHRADKAINQIVELLAAA